VKETVMSAAAWHPRSDDDEHSDSLARHYGLNAGQTGP